MSPTQVGLGVAAVEPDLSCPLNLPAVPFPLEISIREPDPCDPSGALVAILWVPLEQQGEKMGTIE